MEAWSSTTSYDSTNWSPANPDWGQCAVTALVIQDFLGGEILHTVAELPDGQQIHHYYNQLPEPIGDVDITSEQFPTDTAIPRGIKEVEGYASQRDYILSYPLTVQRYLELSERVNHIMQDRVKASPT